MKAFSSPCKTRLTVVLTIVPFCGTLAVETTVSRANMCGQSKIIVAAAFEAVIAYFYECTQAARKKREIVAK